MPEFVNFTLDTSNLSVKDKKGVFYFRYISIVGNTLLLFSEDGEERQYALENRFEKKSVKNFIASAVAQNNLLP